MKVVVQRVKHASCTIDGNLYSSIEQGYLLLVGFTHTDSMKEVNYLAAYMYYYNPREGTPACSYENQIPMEIKKKRLAKIIDIQQEITKVEMKKQLGKTVKVLVENVSRDNQTEMLGRTSRDERVVFEACKDLIGSFVDVKLESLSGNTFKGIMV